VFTLVLLAAVLVLSATGLHTNPGKAASARRACSVEQGPDVRAQRRGDGKSWEKHWCLVAFLACLFLTSGLV